MQKAANMMGVLLTAIMLIGALIAGCGTSDLLEQNNLRYKTNITFSDGEEDDVLTADAVWDLDCNNDGNATDPETFTDLFANITITIDDANTPALEMTGYEVTFQPLQSYDTAEIAITPPSVGSYQGAFDVIIPSESEVVFSITCMELDSKLYIGTFLYPNDPTLPYDWVFRYRVTIKMDFIDEFDEEREITVVRTLYIGNYDNC
jgi:hypothetical protein